MLVLTHAWRSVCAFSFRTLRSFSGCGGERLTLAPAIVDHAQQRDGGVCAPSVRHKLRNSPRSILGVLRGRVTEENTPASPLGAALFAIAVGVMPPLALADDFTPEALMRQLQSRNQHVSPGSLIVWPAASGSVPVPAYPPDCFYDDLRAYLALTATTDTDRFNAVSPIVSSLYDEFANLVPSFVNATSYATMQSGGNPTTINHQLTDFTAVTSACASLADISDCEDCMAQLAAAIPSLRRVVRDSSSSMSQLERTSMSSGTSYDDAGACLVATVAPQVCANANANFTNATGGSTATGLPAAGSHLDFVSLGGTSYSIQASASASDGLFQLPALLSGTAEVWGKVTYEEVPWTYSSCTWSSPVGSPTTGWQLLGVLGNGTNVLRVAAPRYACDPGIRGKIWGIADVNDIKLIIDGDVGGGGSEFLEAPPHPCPTGLTNLASQAPTDSGVEGADGNVSLRACPMLPASGCPVIMVDGSKAERAVDLVVSLNGEDYEFVRDYTSDPTYLGQIALEEDGGGNLIGQGWSSPTFRALVRNNSANQLTLYGSPVSNRVLFTHPTTSVTDRWTAGGATAQFIQSRADTAQRYNGVATSVLRLFEPGDWMTDFAAFDVGEDESDPRSKLRGLPLMERDRYGNLRVFEYQLQHNSARLGFLSLGSRIDSAAPEDYSANSVTSAAELLFGWDLEPESPAVGRLLYVEVRRRKPGTADWFVTDRVDYTYASALGSGAISADVGSGAQLVQVRTKRVVDAVNGTAQENAYYVTVTQYRYHDSRDPSTNADERLMVKGKPGQLKSVINAQQIEYYAQQRAAHEGGTGSWSPENAINTASAELLALSDGASLPAPLAAFTVVDLASKLVKYDTTTGKVVAQYLQTACGCGGSGTQGLKQEYTYSTYNWAATADGLTTRIDERVATGTGQYSSTVYRRHYYDMQRLGGIAYLRFRATEDASSNRWADAYGYDTSSSGHRELVRHYTPSAVQYTPYNGTTAPSFTVRSGGLMYGYTYVEGGRKSETHIGAPDTNSIDSTDVSGIALVEKILYPTASEASNGAPGAAAKRLWLPKQIERYPSTSSSGPDAVELTTFEYGFRNSGLNTRESIDSSESQRVTLAWMKTTVEAGLVAENGAGDSATYKEIKLFDETGNNTWTIEFDNSLTHREFDAVTGVETAAIRNARREQPTVATENPSVQGGSLSQLDPAFSGVDTEIQNAGRWAEGGELATRSVVDVLGRVRKTTGPSGRASFIHYELRDDSERPGIRYAATVKLPMQLSETAGDLDGPVQVGWADAAGVATRTSGFEIDAGEDYDPAAVSYTLATELSRSAVQQHLSGQVSKSRVWHDVAAKWHNTAADTYSETQYAYDEPGRVHVITAPDGTQTRFTYDILDRVTQEEVGTTGSNYTTLREKVYDGGLTSTSGIGNGTLTLVREHTEDSSSMGPTVRDRYNEYDVRDRLVMARAPTDGSVTDGPHTLYVYDNLDRVVEMGVFESVPTSITSSGRTLYVKTFYNQRGLVYKTQRAINPSNDSDGFLETHRWFDAAGRVLEEWGPTASAVKRTYDGLGRVTREYVTDRHDDDAPGATGNWADAGNVLGDYVFEEKLYSFDAYGRVQLERRAIRSQTSGTGAIDYESTSSDVAVQSLRSFVYDAADRVVGTIDYGTNQPSLNEFSAGGVEPTTIPTTVPAFTDSAYAHTIITQITYNSRGLVDTTVDTIDTAPRTTKHFYDDMGRSIATSRNWQSALTSRAELDDSASKTAGRWVFSGIDENAPEEDATTSTTYDAAGNVSRQIAHLNSSSTEKVRITQYVYDYSTRYGTSTVGSNSVATDSLAAANGRLYEVRYPDESTGQPGTSNSLKVRYAYNALGELRSVTDQNGTLHTYERDVFGREVADRATAGTGVDTAVQMIKRKYDNSGRLDWVKSYDGTGSSPNIVNAVRFRYDNLWHIKSVYQNHDGDIATTGGDDGSPTAPTVRVQYGYPSASTSASTNQSRLTSMTYPDGSTVGYAYGTSGEMDDRISRLCEITMTGLVDSNPSSVVKYSYAGLGRISVVDYPLPDVQLDRTFSHNGKRRALALTQQNSGVFPGWDRQGRVQRQAWVDGGLTYNGSVSTTLPTRPPIVEEVYEYDRASRVKSRTDARPGAAWTNRDFKFGYDDDDRLTAAQRGAQGTSSFTNGVGGQGWTLDALGNWLTVGTSSDTDGTFTDNGETVERTFNAANELTQRKVVNNSPVADLIFSMSYDDNGNLTQNPLNSSSNHRSFVYDAWNRLVKVKTVTTAPSTTKYVGYYQYNGLHWRVLARMDTATPVGLDQQRVYTYDAGWRVIQEAVTDFTNDASGLGSPGSTPNRYVQELWGIRSTDDPVLRRVDRNGDGDYLDTEASTSDDELNDHAYWHLTNAQGSTVAMVRQDKFLVERVSYTAYGTALHRYAQDVNNDGTVNSSGTGNDRSAIGALAGTAMVASGGALNTNYDVDKDLDRDGVIDGTGALDTARWDALGNHSSPPGSGLISDRNGPDNDVGYAGYMFGVETKSALARHRWYDPALGRWLTRDPAGVAQGLNLYEYVHSGPFSYLDPLGLCASPPEESWWSNKRHQLHGLVMDYEYWKQGEAQVAREMLRDMATLAGRGAMLNPAHPGAGVAMIIAENEYRAAETTARNEAMGDEPSGAAIAGVAVRRLSGMQALSNSYTGFDPHQMRFLDPLERTSQAFTGVGTAGLLVLAPLSPKAAPCVIDDATSTAAATARGVLPEAPLSQVASRQLGMLERGVGYNVSPEKWFAKYSELGKGGTFVTDAQSLMDIGFKPMNAMYRVGLFDDIGTISVRRAALLEDSLGLNEATLMEGFRITEIGGLAGRSPASPLGGNARFLGAGKGLPGGGPEMQLFQRVTTFPWPPSP